MVSTKMFGTKMRYLLLAALLTVPFGASVAADVDVFNAQIDRIGLFFPDDVKGPMIQLTDLSGTAWAGSRQFFLSQAFLGTEGLAIVLTAFSLGKDVFVRIATDAAPLSLVTVIYVNR